MLIVAIFSASKITLLHSLQSSQKKHRPSTRFSPLAGQYFKRIKSDQPHEIELRNPLPNRDLSQPQNLTLKQSSQPRANAYSHLTLPHLNCGTLQESREENQLKAHTTRCLLATLTQNCSCSLLYHKICDPRTPPRPPLPQTALKFSKKGLVLSKDPKRVLNEMLITKKKGEKGAETGQERSRRAMAGGEVAKRCCSFPCHRQRSLPETSSTNDVHSGHKCALLVHIRVVRGQRALVRGSRMWISYPRTY